MTFIKISPAQVEPAVIRYIAGSLQRGQVLILPTDTIYGLSCLATDARAIRKIQGLKKREAKKPLAVLASDRTMLKKYVFLSPSQEKIISASEKPKQRPTTFILRHRGRLPEILTAPSDGLAVRLPKSEFLTKIIRLLGAPLVSTSLNRSGQEPLSDLKDLSRYFPSKLEQPDLVVDAGPARRRKASKLIDLRGKRPLVLRK